MDLIPTANLNRKITIIGAGAIGSFTALQLAKMGVQQIAVYDFDDVSIENMNGQFYRFKDIGTKKVKALQSLVYDFTNVMITPNEAKLDAKNLPLLSGIVLLAVDSMDARKELFNAIAENCPMVTHVIDTRMGAEDALMYVMQPQLQKDRDTYGKTLYTNAEAVQERCTAKATIYTANLLSGHAVKATKNILCDEQYPRITMWSIRGNDQKVHYAN
jgi:tRNA A37 threonylcarbamoyladenosine dehydratase